MYRDDYLLNQVNLLGRILGKVLANFLKTEDDSSIIENEELNSIFKQNTGITFKEFLELPIEKISEFLSNNKKMGDENFESLAEILVKLGEQTNENQKLHVTKALLILQFLEDNSTIFSNARIQKIDELKKLLEGA